MAEYTLPELDYDYGVLAPRISGYINEFQHRKRHTAYVQGANDALRKLAHARARGDHSAIFCTEKNLAFHLGGHVNHSISWKNLSPHGGDKPIGELAAALDDAFGSFDSFRAQFSKIKSVNAGFGPHLAEA